MWGFGFEGQVAFEDGVIRAWSEEPLEGSQHMTLMLSLKKGLWDRPGLVGLRASQLQK